MDCLLDGNSSANLIAICESNYWLTVPRSSKASEGLEFITSSSGGVELHVACKLIPKGDESGWGVAEGSVPWKGKLEFRSDERAVRTMLPLIGFEQRGLKYLQYLFSHILMFCSFSKYISQYIPCGMDVLAHQVGPTLSTERARSMYVYLH